MLNYLSAELYKLRRHKGLYVVLALVAVGMAALFLPAFWTEIPGNYPDSYVFLTILPVALFVGFLLAPILALTVFDDQFGRGTLKNEVVFGATKRRAYLGKLLAGGLAGVVVSVLLLAAYGVLAALVTGGRLTAPLWGISTVMEGAAWLWSLMAPMWLAQYAFTFCLLVVVGNTSAGVALAYMVTFFGTSLAMVGGKGSPFLWFFQHLFFTAPLRAIMVYDSWNVFYAWGVGMGWMTVTSAIGLWSLYRRELR